MDAVRENYYHKYINDSQNMLKAMPLVHICDCFTFRKILATGVISPTLCKVFNKQLSYFFYGRPSYRVGPNNCTSNATSMFPICFIIEPGQINSISGAYPFDTGAFQQGFFSRYVHPKASVSDYELVGELEFIQKFVGYFYETNSCYYDGVSTVSNNSLPAMAYELQSVYQMITSQATEEFDDRCHTIEIQSSQAINLSSGGIKAMVLPSSIAQDPEISAFLLDNDVEPIIYQTTRCSPSSVTSTIITEVRKYYEDEGVFQ